jgi:hypothetical protein
MRDRGAQALQASVGMGDRAFLLRVGLRWEHHVGVFADAVSEEARVCDDRRGAVERSLPELAAGQLKQRIRLQQVERGQLARGQSVGDPGSVASNAIACARGRWIG